MSFTRPARVVLATAVLLGTLTLAPRSTVAHASVTPSAGCGHAWTPGTNVSGTLAYDGLQRVYLLHIPKGYTPATPLPLILNLPGSGMTARNEEWLTQMSTTADSQRFLVVYPQGTTGLSKALGWNTFPTNEPGWSTSAYRNVNDVGFLNALVTSLEGQVCVDTSRIGVTGISDGAVMAYRMGCANLPWVAAIAPVAGTMFGIQSECQMAHPTPLLAINGMKDPIVWYDGYYPGDAVPQVIANWAHAVGCPTTGTPSLSQGDVSETVYSPCSNGADTELYTVADGGHTWPGGSPMPWFGVTSTTINASALIGTFIATHPLH